MLIQFNLIEWWLSLWFVQHEVHFNDSLNHFQCRIPRYITCFSEMIYCDSPENILAKFKYKTVTSWKGMQENKKLNTIKKYKGKSKVTSYSGLFNKTLSGKMCLRAWIKTWLISNGAILIDHIDQGAIKLSGQCEADSRMIENADEWEQRHKWLLGRDHGHMQSLSPVRVRVHASLCVCKKMDSALKSLVLCRN